MNRNKFINIITITFLNLVFGLSIFAQSPDKISYQAIIRNSSNELVSNQEVGIQISILQSTVNGIAVYTETHTPTTNANGLISIEIGAGNILNGNFAAIDWGSGPYFIKTEVDPSGGANYTITGTSQLMSVPYALHSKTTETIVETDPVFDTSLAGKINSSDLANWNNKQNKLFAGAGISIDEDTISTLDDYESLHYVGELFGGGIVFWVDPSGKHGLIASLNDLDQGNGAEWGVLSDVNGCESMIDGAANTAAIIAAGAGATTAAGLCNSYSGGGFTDWYLPSLRELSLLCSHDILIDKILDNDDDPNTNGFCQENIAPAYGRYWSSTEKNGDHVRIYFFRNDEQLYYLIAAFMGDVTNVNEEHKDNMYGVRAIRAF